MRDKHLFEYAVIRLVPRVEREEFLNVGVVLYCTRMRFLKMKYYIDPAKIKSFCVECDVAEIEKYLEAFEKICNGNRDSGPIAKLPIAERFRWLTATRSTVVQTSKVHPGFCDDAGEMLENLFLNLVK